MIHEEFYHVSRSKDIVAFQKRLLVRSGSLEGVFKTSGVESR